MFGIKSLNDENGCNVASMNYLNIQNANDDCTSHGKMFLISMSIFAEWIWSAIEHQKGKIDFVRSINIYKWKSCKRG